METKTQPTSAIEKSKYLNQMDEVFGTICSLISLEILFHISSCKTPHESWTTMEGIFGKQDEIRGHILEVEFLTLDPKTFDNLQDLFTKYKNLLLQLKDYRVDKSKEEKQMVLTILSKLVLEYSVFVSTFHSVGLSYGVTWKMPSLEVFIESLTQEMNKLINMEKNKGPKAHALTLHDGSGHQNKKYKYKDKRKAHANPKKEGYSKPFNDASGFKGGKGRKWEKCTYCHKGFHPKYACIQIDQMAQIFKKNNLGDHILKGVKKKKLEDQNPKEGNSSHALIVVNSSTDAWIVDSGVSHHMEATKKV
jgi:hypothetical protein